MFHQVAHKRVKSHRRRDEETVLRGEPANSQQASGEEQHTVGKCRNVKVVTEKRGGPEGMLLERCLISMFLRCQIKIAVT